MQGRTLGIMDEPLIPGEQDASEQMAQLMALVDHTREEVNATPQPSGGGLRMPGWLNKLGEAIAAGRELLSDADLRR